MCIAIKYNWWHVQSHIRQRALLAVVSVSLGDKSEVVAQQVSVAYCSVSREARNSEKIYSLLSMTVNMTSFHAFVE